MSNEAENKWIEETGGCAFPFVSNGGLHEHQCCYQGMSLRDYFAAKAMQGWLATYGDESTHPCSNGQMGTVIAVNSYRLADAMLEARKEKKG